MDNIPSNHDYYRRRERECRELAARAVDPHIRKLHLDFAERYAREVGDAPIADPRDEPIGGPSLARA